MTAQELRDKYCMTETESLEESIRGIDNFLIKSAKKGYREAIVKIRPEYCRDILRHYRYNGFKITDAFLPKNEYRFKW